MTKLLKELLTNIEKADITCDEDIDIESIEYYSKNVKKGSLFVCVRGYKADGHDYILEAIRRGAAAIVVEKFQQNCNIPQIRVKNCRHALAALAAAFYDKPSEAMKIIGITATNGKTTTSFMINSILESNGYKTGLIGTVKIKCGNYSEISKLTTPESLDLQRYFSEMKKNNVSHVTMEVSSAALALNRVDEVDFDIVSLHNISREHIDFHGSFQDYFNSKASLIKNAKSNQWAILNLDCPYSASLENETKARVITFGIEKNSGHFYCRNLGLSSGRAKFTVEIRKNIEGLEHIPKKFRIELAVPGYHSVYNSMVAIITALICKVPINIIQENLKNFKGVERRFEFIYEGDFKIIDDHFANSGNINVTLETLKYMHYKKLQLVYAIRGNRGLTVNRENAQTIVKWAKELDLKEITATLSKNHVSEKDTVQTEEAEIFKRVMHSAGIKVHMYEELTDAIEYGISKTRNGDVLLLAGCQGMDFGAEIALEKLYQLKPYLSKDKLFETIKYREILTKELVERYSLN